MAKPNTENLNAAPVKWLEKEKLLCKEVSFSCGSRRARPLCLSLWHTVLQRRVGRGRGVDPRLSGTASGVPARASHSLRNLEPSLGRPLVVEELTGLGVWAGTPSGQRLPLHACVPLPSQHTCGCQCLRVRDDSSPGIVLVPGALWTSRGCSEPEAFGLVHALPGLSAAPSFQCQAARR